MRIDEPREPVIVTDSEMEASSFSGVEMTGWYAHVDGYLVSDPIAAIGKKD